MKLPWPLAKIGAFLLPRGKSGATDVPIQTAALPWRCTRGGDLEILLITGRSSQRWLIPKGWPMHGKSLAEAAAQEAFEEAGVEGRIAPEPIGRFAHMKRHGVPGPVRMTVIVHALAVERELAEWPERGERTRRWFSLEEALSNVASDELRVLIHSLAAAHPAKSN